MTGALNGDLRKWLAADSALTAEDLTERLRKHTPASDAGQSNLEVHRTLRRMAGFGPLAKLLANDNVNDICINGPGEVLVDAGGAWHRSGIHLDADELDVVVERLLAHTGKRADRLRPMVDARLSDGSRINVAAAPVGLNGPIVTIRRFRSETVPLADFGTAEQVRGLRRALQDRSNILVSGATGAGKTSLLGALLEELPTDERLVVIEDTAELAPSTAAAVRLEAQAGSADAPTTVTLRDLVRNALRMRPDRLVVGEVRGPEALDLLLALNTGHRGSLATCHGSGCREVLQRLGLLAQLNGEADPAAVERLVSSGIDVVVHLQRAGGERRIGELLFVRPARAGRPDEGQR